MELYLNSKWINRFMDLAYSVAEWSEDTSTRVGCVAVNQERKQILSTGYNGLPRGVRGDRDKRRFERPTKYFYFEHAERNCIYNACYNHVDLKDSVLFVTHTPCADCARAIIQSGIKCVVVDKTLWNRKGKKNREEALSVVSMFHESGVELYKYSKDFEQLPKTNLIPTLFQHSIFLYLDKILEEFK